MSNKAETTATDISNADSDLLGSFAEQSEHSKASKRTSKADS